VDVTDDTLIGRVRAGDDVAFEALVDRYYPACLRFAWRQLGGREDAEEAVQDALVRAYRALMNGTRPHNCRAWMMSIVVNRCRSVAARERRRTSLFERFRSVHAPDTVTRPAYPAGDIDARVRRALERLSPVLRESFLLRHVEEMTYDEMAAVTGARVSALKMRVKRATEALARMLEDPDDRTRPATR
jgi:RNA polymerase sigma-70 factor (ECF subfamily)